MCVACIEFVKETLTFKEYQAALWEVTREDEGHLVEVEALIRQNSRDPKILREKLEQRLGKSPSSRR